MVYQIEGLEKWKVFIKSENISGKQIDEKFGVEIGITEHFSFQEAVQAENKFENVVIMLIINELNRNFCNKISIIHGKHITLYLLGQDSNKILHISGYFYRSMEVGKSEITCKISSGEKSKKYNIKINLSDNL